METKKIKLAIIGACCTRDAFNKIYTPNWREYFDVVQYKFHMSMISMFSCPIPYSRKMLPSLSERTFWDNIFIDECAKDFCNQFVSVQPEFLLIDFYSDVYNGIFEINGYSYIIDRSCRWGVLPAFKEMNVGRKLSVSINYEEYIEKWKKSFDRFMKFMKEYSPNTKLIINSIKFGKDVLTPNGKIYEFKRPGIDIDLLNKAWQEMDDYATNVYGIPKVDYAGKKYFLDPDYPFGGKWMCHFHKDYHKDLFDKVLELCNDYPINRHIMEKGNENEGYNVLLNGSFNLGTLFWKYWEKAFFIKKDYITGTNICAFNEVSEDGKKFNQCWSNDIEVDTDTEYTLSFYSKVTKPELLAPNNIIFAIRVFAKRGLQKAKESMETILVKYDSVAETDEEGFAKYTYSFVPKGRWVSVGPFISQKGIVEWKNIVFCRGNAECASEESVSESLLLERDDVLVDINTQQITNLRQLKCYLP